MQLLHVSSQVFSKCYEEGPAALCACRFLLVHLGLKSLDLGSNFFDFVQQVSTLFMRHRALIPGLRVLVSVFRSEAPWSTARSRACSARVLESSGKESGYWESVS